MNEVQDIFRLYGEAYRQKHDLPLPTLKAMSAIERCRTGELGAHADVCEDCGHTRISYNSCRDRHCPKCQFLSRERWIQSRNYDLLNVGYFHVVFTIPDTLNTLVFQNQRELYPIIFRAAAEAMRELSANRKYLGAQIGVTSILHTCYSDKNIIPTLRYDNEKHLMISGCWGLLSLNIGIIIDSKLFLPLFCL